MKKYQLMAPGPTPVPPTVLLAMAQPIIHHRAAEYDALFSEVREGLKRLVQTRQDVLVPACTKIPRGPRQLKFVSKPFQVYFNWSEYVWTVTGATASAWTS